MKPNGPQRVLLLLALLAALAPVLLHAGTGAEPGHDGDLPGKRSRAAFGDVSPAGTAARGPVADFSGRWRMCETDEGFQAFYSECMLDIRQTGDAAEIRAWKENEDWDCRGRGIVRGNRLTFFWQGDSKHWRGECSLELNDGALSGTYLRRVDQAEVQFCKGVKE